MPSARRRPSSPSKDCRPVCPVVEVGGVEGLAEGGDLDLGLQGLALAHQPVHHQLAAAAHGHVVAQVGAADAELADVQVVDPQRGGALQAALLRAEPGRQGLAAGSFGTGQQAGVQGEGGGSALRTVWAADALGQGADDRPGRLELDGAGAGGVEGAPQLAGGAGSEAEGLALQAEAPLGQRRIQPGRRGAEPVGERAQRGQQGVKGAVLDELGAGAGVVAEPDRLAGHVGEGGGEGPGQGEGRGRGGPPPRR